MTFPEHTITALLGLAVGDAFGCPFEYHEEAPKMSRLSLDQQRYLRGYEDCKLPPRRCRTPGLGSDDTQQSLVLLWVWQQMADKGRNPLDALFVQGVFQRIVRTMADASVPGHSFGVHRGTGRNFRDAVTSGKGVNTAGLGAAMRIGPVATLLEDDIVAPWTSVVSEATTTNALALAGAAMLAQVAQRGGDREFGGWCATTTPSGSASFLEAWALLEEARQHLERTGVAGLMKFASKHTEEDLKGPASGFVLTGVPWVLRAVEEALDFPDALRLVASEGGDTDTVCAMTGCLAALRFGREAIPSWMLEGLVGREHLLDPNLWHPIRTELDMAELDHQLRKQLAGKSRRGR